MVDNDNDACILSYGAHNSAGIFVAVAAAFLLLMLGWIFSKGVEKSSSTEEHYKYG